MTGKKDGTWKKRIVGLTCAAALIAAGAGLRHLLAPAPAVGQSPQRPAPRAQNAQAAPNRAAAPQPVQRAAAQAPAPNLAEMPTMAMVNGHKISREQLAQECILRFGDEMLESIVNKHLIAQACQQQGIQITRQDVDREIAAAAGKFGLDVDKWLELLREKRNISYEKYQNEIIWPTLALRKLAASQIQVTEEDLRKAFESEYGAKVRVRLITAATRERAMQLQQMAAANPKSFGDLAKEHSADANSASARGLIPPIRKHVGDPAIERVAFALKEGEISQVVEAGGQFLILMCERVLPETYIPSEDVPRVREQLSEGIRDEKLRVAAAGLFKELQQNSKVVMVYNDPQLRQQHPGVAALINGRAVSLQQLSLECLERHGVDVLEGEINRAVISQELARRQLTVTQADIDEEIRRAADAYGYAKDGTVDVQGWLKDVTEADSTTVELYIRDAVWPSVALKALVKDRVQVTEADLQKGFETNYGERVRVLAIVLASHRQAQEVWELAKKDGTDRGFGELAYKYSIEPVSRANYGQVPPIRKHSGHDNLEKEAYRLQPNELSSIVATGDKYIVMWCLGRTEPKVTDPAAVRNELHRDLFETKIRGEMAKEFDRLRESSQVNNLVTQTVSGGNIQPAAAAARAPARPAGPQPQPIRR